MNKMTFLYIWDFCKFLFESNATQTTKIHLIKYTVVIFLASSLFLCSFWDIIIIISRVVVVVVLVVVLLVSLVKYSD